jgi:uncharacterized protein YqjF (DUF2071 family)
MPIAFLRAEWRHLAMLNYRVPPALLEPLVPAGTQLDAYDGVTYVSVVGFLFERTRILGLTIPFHKNFEEVNLRFYVRRAVAGEVRRGVTFIRELVPRAAIAMTASVLYNEPYRAMTMRHRIDRDGDSLSGVEYGWSADGDWTTLRAAVAGPSQALTAGSEEEFITEHYWGYTRQRDGGTVEYRVEHAPWRVWRATAASLDGNLAGVYGDAFATVLAGPPQSAFVADGSAVTVYSPSRIT